MIVVMPVSLGNASSKQLLAVLLWLLLSTGGRGYPGGAPDMACESMLPTGHGVGPQASDPPYSIMVSKKSYKPGETLQIIVSSEGEDYFKGMFVQARVIGCQLNETKTVGVFTAPDNEIETKHCFGEVHSAVTHNSARAKRVKTFYWTAPVLPAGHMVMSCRNVDIVVKLEVSGLLYFCQSGKASSSPLSALYVYRATLVREIDQYWTDVESHLVADLHSDTLPRCPQTTSTAPSTTRSASSPSPSSTPGQSSTTTSVSRDQGVKTSPHTTRQKQAETTNIFAAGKGEEFKLVTRLVTTIKEAERQLVGKAESRETERKLEKGRGGLEHSVTSTDSMGPFPSWLGPSFNRKGGHVHTTQVDAAVDSASEESKKLPSWLIPAYQRSASSSSTSSLRCADGGHRVLFFTVVSVVLAWLRLPSLTEISTL
ncbi:hypothetical protein BaRGS_00006614 [Batillaria attramentaria]|uniref:Reelin domain-containing protein n=1 Tax=Batillaria attramentaria TaxID=370345 RepID=A0ABD0LRQ2_9CAEN